MSAQQPNQAGLVIRYGDGHLIYRVVEFSEPEITGIGLLVRSQLALVTSAYSGMGQGVWPSRVRRGFRRPALGRHQRTNLDRPIHAGERLP